MKDVICCRYSRCSRSAMATVAVARHGTLVTSRDCEAARCGCSWPSKSARSWSCVKVVPHSPSPSRPSRCFWHTSTTIGSTHGYPSSGRSFGSVSLKHQRLHIQKTLILPRDTMGYADHMARDWSTAVCDTARQHCVHIGCWCKLPQALVYRVLLHNGCDLLPHAGR